MNTFVGTAMENDRTLLLKNLIGAVNEISAISGFRCVVKKQCRDLSRRVKLLTPLFEEFMEMKEEVSEETVRALVLLMEALELAKEFLRIGSRGSKIILVLQSEHIKSKFQELTLHFEEALSRISYDKLDIPNEIKEQVELVQAQFGRAKERIGEPDLKQYEELFFIYNQNYNVDTDPAIISTLCEKLELMTTEDLKEELLAHEMLPMSSGDVEERLEKMSVLLKKIEDFLQAENPQNSNSARENCSPRNSGQACTNLGLESPVAPDDFCCPISLELMKDPVIVCTGQTYERAFIKKWLEAGHGTCPKTKQNIFSTALTPNHALSSIITNWCEINGVEPPKRSGNSCPGKNSCGSVVAVEITTLLSKLTSDNIEDQRAAAGELRLLAKNNSDNRMFIAEAGAIPFLLDLCYTSDLLTQEHAVTALLNLSICEDNKRSIMHSRAIPGILHVLQQGSMEARENAAATIFSLSVLDEYKVMIGASGAIPELVTLLREGSQRGKKDAATALFNLCIFQGNKGRAIRAGVVPLLMMLLVDPGGEMVDEALAIMAMLSGHPEGKIAIGAVEAVPLFVKLVENGSPRNKENAAAALVNLCGGDHRRLIEARDLGVRIPLLELAENGSERGRRKAAQLLELMGNFEEQQEIVQLEADTQGEDETQSLHISSVVYS